MQSRFLLTSVIISVLLILCGCAKPVEKDGTSSSDTSDNAYTETIDGEYVNTSCKVLDSVGKQLGELNIGGAATVADSGILYTAWKNGSGGQETEYRIFDPASGTDSLIGVMEEQSYEAAFARNELGGRIYTLAVTGNLFDNDPDTLWLIELDPSARALYKHRIPVNGFPYSGMTCFNGKLLLFCHDQQDVLNDRVFEFDSAAKDGEQLRQVLCYTLSNGLDGDSVRQIYSDGDKLYILRLRFSPDGNVRAFVDAFDGQYNAVGQHEVTETLTSATDIDGGDKVNELKQHVSRFAVIDGKYLYYENFSITRCLAELESGRLIAETDGLFCASSGSGEITFFKSYGGNLSGDGNNNEVLNLKDGRLQSSVFNADDKAYYLTSVSCSSGGAKLIQMNTPASDSKPILLYYLNK